MHAVTRLNGQKVAFMHWAPYWVTWEEVPEAAKADWLQRLGQQQPADMDATLAAASSGGPALILAPLVPVAPPALLAPQQQA